MKKLNSFLKNALLLLLFLIMVNNAQAQRLNWCCLGAFSTIYDKDSNMIITPGLQTCCNYNGDDTSCIMLYACPYEEVSFYLADCWNADSMLYIVGLHTTIQLTYTISGNPVYVSSQNPPINTNHPITVYWTQPGTYQIIITVNVPGEVPTSNIGYITVLPSVSSSLAASIDSACLGNNQVCVSLINNPYGYDTLSQSQINWGDLFMCDGQLISTGQPIMHQPYCFQYLRQGTYQISGLITNGCDSIYDTVIVVVSLEPDFTWQGLCSSDSVLFNGTVCNSSYLGAWHWNFGDGDTSNLQNPSHLYQTPGTYNVTLTVYDNFYPCPGSTSITHQVTIFGIAKPEIVGNNNNCDTTTLYSTGNYNPNYNYNWSVGNPLAGTISPNGNTATVNWVPIFAYAGQDIYFTYLIVQVTDSNGCSAIDSIKIFECCLKDGTSNAFNNQINDTIISSPVNINSGSVFINGTITINSNVSINGLTMNMGPEAKIIVNRPYNLTITWSTLRAGCRYMWTGIEIYDSLASLTFDNNKINDAYIAIDAKYKPALDITNDAFTNNNIGIKMRQFINPVTSTINIYHDTFHSSIISGNYSFLPPLEVAYKKPFTGIEIEKCNKITIGDEINGSSKFSIMYYGIRSINSDISVFNNEFDSIHNHYGGGSPILSMGNPVGACIYSLNTQLFLYFGNIIPGIAIGGSTAKANSFSNSDYGTFIRCNHHFLVSMNNFDANGTSVYANENTHFTGSKIIHDNTINTVKNTGIELQTLRNCTTQYNTITNISVPPNGSLQSVRKYGIHAQGCITSTIYGNYIANGGMFSYSPDLRMEGISVNGGTNTVSCNDIEKMGKDMAYYGNAPSTITRNEMHDSKWGFYNNGFIGNQMPNGQPSDNSWFGSFMCQTRNDGIATTLYVRLLGNEFHPTLNCGISPPFNIILHSGAAGLCKALPIPLSRNPFVINREAGRMIYLDSVVYSDNVDNNKWISGFHLYNCLKDLPEDSLSDWMEDFLENYDVNNKNIATIDALIDTNEIKGAEAILDETEAQSSPANQYLSIYRVMIDAINNSGKAEEIIYNDEQLSELREVAKLCPYEEGDAVYLARTILSQYESTVYYNSCEIADSLSIRGYVKSIACGGIKPIVNDTVAIIDTTLGIVPNITPAITDTAGYFKFNVYELMLLDTAARYSFVSKRGLVYTDTVFKTVNEWIAGDTIMLHLSKLKADFSYDQIYCLGMKEHLISLPKYGLPPYTYNWDFVFFHSHAKDTAIRVDSAGVAYIIATIDSIPVTLMVSDNFGCIDTISKNLDYLLGLNTCPTICGNIYESFDCGGAPLVNDTMVITNISNNIVPGITPAITNSNGYFKFDFDELYDLVMLASNKSTYNITVKNGFELDGMTPDLISNWALNSPLSLSTTNVHEQWVAFYSGPDSINDFASALDLAQNIYVVGRSADSSGEEFAVIKYNPNGNVKWIRRLDTAFANYPLSMSAITTDSLGNVFIAGVLSTVYEKNKLSILTTIKIDSTSKIKWIKAYPYDIFVDKSASIIGLYTCQDSNIIVGFSNKNNPYYIVVKYDTKGQILWSIDHNSTEYPPISANSFVIDSIGNSYISGQISDNWGVTGQFATIMLDPDGNLIKEYYFTENENENYNATSNVVDINGNIFVTGFGGSNNDIVTVRYNVLKGDTALGIMTNSAGSLGYDSLNITIPPKIVCDNFGNMYVYGTGVDDGLNSFFMIKYDTARTQIWEIDHKRVGENNFNTINKVVVGNDGDLYIAGTTGLVDSNNSALFLNYFTVRLTPDSVMKWYAYYRGPTNLSQASCMKVSPNGNVYVTGGSRRNKDGLFEFATVKYSQCPSVANLRNHSIPTTNSSIPVEQHLKVYPNPTKDEFYVEYSGEVTGQVMVTELYNIYGALTKEIQVSNKNKFTVSTRDVPSGIYFYRLRLGNNVLGKDKIVIIK